MQITTVQLPERNSCGLSSLPKDRMGTATTMFSYALSRLQLMARCTELSGGTFFYDPPAGTELPLGTHTYVTIRSVSKSTSRITRKRSHRVEVSVKEAQLPELWWTQPEDIPYNTPLSQFQLNATCNVPDGFFYYDPHEAPSPRPANHIL